MFKNFIHEQVHMIKTHTKDLVYSMIIFLICSMLAELIVIQALKFKKPSEWFIIIYLISTIPVALFFEYSAKNIGYKNSILASFKLYLILASTALLVSGTHWAFLSQSTIYILIVILILSIIFSFGDKCSCLQSKNN